MARYSLQLNTSKPVATASLPWHAATIECNNPTGSAILARIGGTDQPTRDSANLIIPQLTLYQAPARATNFSFALDNPSAVGTLVYPFKNALINLLSVDEPIGNIGSAYQLSAPQGVQTYPISVDNPGGWVSLGAVSTTQFAIIGWMADFIQSGGTTAGTAPIITIGVNVLGGALGTIAQTIWLGQASLPFTRAFSFGSGTTGIVVNAGGPVLAFNTNAQCVCRLTLYWIPLL